MVSIEEFKLVSHRRYLETFKRKDYTLQKLEWILQILAKERLRVVGEFLFTGFLVFLFIVSVIRRYVLRREKKEVKIVTL